MSSSIHYPSINSDRNIDDLDINRKYDHNNIQPSSTTQVSNDFETVVSCSSKSNIQSSIEKVVAKNLAPCSEKRESQVRNNLDIGSIIMLVG